MGCFVACVAMVAGTTFKQARRLLGLEPKQGNALSPEEALKRIPFRVRRNDNWMSSKRSIVFLRWRHCPTIMHAIVWDGKKIIDPGSDYPVNLYTVNEHFAAAYTC